MLKPVQSILFATDLTENCQQALEFTFILASNFNATVVMLHIIQHLPVDIEGKLKGLLGRHQWDELVNAQQEFVRKSLLGKKTTAEKIKEQVKIFCQLPGGKILDHQVQSKEIIISEGEVINVILDQARKNRCDLIVLGAKENYLARNSIGATIHGVLERAITPVSIIPAKSETL
ncbi:MAG: universal stress protein [Desulfopila sp.]